MTRASARKTCQNLVSPALFVSPPFRLGTAGVLLSAELPPRHGLDFTIEVTATLTDVGQLRLSVRRYALSDRPTATMDLGAIIIEHDDEIHATVELLRQALDAVPTLLAARALAAQP